MYICVIMAYKKIRKYRKRRKAYRKREFVGAVKKVINGQMEKHAYQASINSTINSTGTIFDLSAITQGDTAAERDGDRLTIKSLSLKMGIIAGDPTNFMRVIIFQWLQNSATVAPSVINIFPAVFVTQPYSFGSPYSKPDAGYTFIPLYDKTFVVSSTDNVRFNIKLTPKNFKRKAKAFIQYNPASTTGTGKLYMCAISDSGAVTHPTLLGCTQLRFLTS